MSQEKPKLILGSGSPRRLELLDQLGVTPDAIRPPDIDETPRAGETPRPYCIRMAHEKVLAVKAEDNWIQGSYSAVMGLPVAETYALLRASGYPLEVDL